MPAPRARTSARLAALRPKARARFMRDLAQLVDFNNDISRTPWA